MSRGFHFLQSQPLDRVTPPWLVKPAPSSHEPVHQRNQAPVTLIYQWKKLRRGGGGGKRMIQRLNEESGPEENAETDCA